jgi:hypothetical protein
LKYQTFILIRNSVGAGLVALAGFGIIKGCTSATQRPAVSSHVPDENLPGSRQTAAPARSQPRRGGAPVHQALAASAADAPARQQLSALDRKVIGYSKEPLTNGAADGDARKWRIKENRIVIELRSDTGKGSTTWNRLKIDLDRDKNWDEAWDLKPGKPIKRRIAPADDENYTVTYDLQGETWVKRDK